MPFPFLYPALALTAGILASAELALPASASLPALIGSLLIAWAFYGMRKIKAAFIFLLAAAVFFGASLTAHQEAKYEANGLHLLRLDDYADFYGILIRTPSAEIERDVILMKVERVETGNKSLEIRGILQLSVPRSTESGRLSRLYTGDRIKASARLLTAKDFNNFNNPFYARYLKSRNIHKRAFTKSPLLIEKIGPSPERSVFHALSVLRRSLGERLEIYFPQAWPVHISPQGAILEALLLGNDGRLDPDTVSSLQKTGLYHLFAISGAHIAIVSFLLYSLLNLIRIPKRLSYGILIVSLVFYAFLVEGSPSVLRAVIMTLALLIGKLFWKDVNWLNTISLSAFALLWVNPFSLFDLGFQLTFAATLSIILFYPRLFKYFPRLPLRISELTALSVTATLGVMPIIIRDFNRVTFASLLLNYAAVPLVSLIMGLGYVFFPLSFAASFLARPLAQGLGILVRFFSRLSHVLDPVGFLSYRIPTPPDFALIGYFFFLLMLLAPQKIKSQKIIASAALAAFFIILIIYPFSSRSSELKVTVLDVGQGDSILIEFPGSRKMLIDGGGFPEGTFDVGERVVSPFLWRKGIKKIDYLVLTHAHPDHFNGLPAVARNFRINEFWEAGSTNENDALKTFRDALGSSVFQRKVSRGYERRVSGTVIEVFHPQKEEGPVRQVIDNDLSLVLRISCGRVSFLLPGDIGKEAEAEILEAIPRLKSQVLKSPHHGSDSSSSAAFLEKVSPEFIVISAGEGNRYGFPQTPVLERYIRSGARVLRTDVDGAVEFSTDGQTIHVRTAAASAAGIQ